MTQIPLSIVVIDNHPLMRTALSSTLATEDGMQVLAEYANSREFFNDARKITPRMILLGISNPGHTELETIRPLRASFPGAMILALVTGELAGQDQEALQNGAHSVLEKTISRAELLATLQKIRQSN